MAHLARAGVEVPAPIPDRTGALFSLLNGKPAGLVERIDGAPVDAPDPAHCAEVGAALARLHLASQTYRARLTNRRGPAWWRQAARAVKPHLSASQAALLDGEIKFQTGFGRGKLPKGAIHGDLFCDNVLFDGVRVAGIIDFGFAATDFFAYDLAITVNDWCVEANGGALDAATRAMRSIQAYDALRPLDAGRARGMAVAVARRGVALLAVASVRPAPAAPGRAHARPRPGAFRAHPARLVPPTPRAGFPLARRRLTSASMSDVPREFVFTRYPARQGIVWLRTGLCDVQAPSRRMGAAVPRLSHRACWS